MLKRVFSSTTKVSIPTYAPKFLSNVYKSSALSFGSTIVGSTLLAACGVSGFTPIVAGGVGMMVATYQIDKIKGSKTVLELTDKENKDRKRAFYALVGCASVVLAPVTSMVLVTSPAVIPIAGMLTGGIMGSASYFALRQPPGKLITWGPTLSAALWGSIGMGLVSILSHLAIGPNPLSMMWFTAEPYLGIAMFTALTAYDTQKALAMFESGDPDEIGCVTSLYLDAVNLYSRLMDILSRFGKSDADSEDD